MSDSAALFRVGIALAEAGKAMSAQAASVHPAQEGEYDHTQPLLSGIGTMNQSLRAVEGHLASVASATSAVKDSIDGLTRGLAELQDGVTVQNQILRASLDAQRDVKKLAHLMAVMLVDISNKLPLTGTEVPDECAREINSFAGPDSLQTPLAFVHKPAATRGHYGGTQCFPRTAGDIGRLNHGELASLLVAMSGISRSSLDLAGIEELQLLVCKGIGLSVVSNDPIRV